MQYLFILMALFLLLGCSDDKEKSATSHVVIAEMQEQNSVLAYAATIEPISLMHVVPAVNGIIDSLYFRVGEQVRKGDILLILRSDELKEKFETTLTDYLKKRDEYQQQLNVVSVDEQLHDLGLISDNEHANNKRKIADLYLQLRRAENLTKQFIDSSETTNPLSFETIEKLSLENYKELADIFDQELNKIAIRAHTFGVPLLLDGADNKNKEMVEGTAVKANEPILQLGDLTGIAVTIEVNETDLADVRVGQSAVVTGVAFPGIILNGIVGNIDIQQTSGGHSQSAMFRVRVIVPHLDQAARRQIRPGMSAKVEITTETATHLVLPIAAVFEEDGEIFVRRLLDEKIQNFEQVLITPGKTSLGHVVIEDGLSAGDKILVSD